MEIEIVDKPLPASRSKFWLTWIGWNALGYFVLLLVNLILQILSQNGWLSFQGSSFARTLVSIAAIALEVVALGWAQQRALRRYLKKPYLWFLATALPWGLINLASGGSFYAKIQNWLANGGSAANLNNSAWLMVLAFFVIIGGYFPSALFQWLVLRLEVRKAQRWLAWTAGSWILYALIALSSGPLIIPAIQSFANQAGFTTYVILISLYEFILYLISPVVNGIGMARILIPQPAGQGEDAGERIGEGATIQPVKEQLQAEKSLENGEEATRKDLVLRLALATLIAMLAAPILTYLGLADLLAGLVSPLIKALGSVNLIAAAISSILAGLLIGFAQVHILGNEYSRRWVWVAATAIGFLFQGINSQVPVEVIYNWATGSQVSSPNLFYEYFLQFSTSIYFWLALGLLQTLALLQWVGKRAWAWLLMILAIEAAALLVRLIFGFQLEQAGMAIAISWALVFFLRTGWQNVIILVPQTEEPPTPDELSLAAEILADRLKDSYPLRGQVEIEDGLLVASFNNRLDADLAAELAFQRGKVIFFEAASSLEIGIPLPADIRPLLTEADILSAAVINPNANIDPPALLVELTDEGFQKLSEYWAAHPDFTMGFALDNEVLLTFPAETPNLAGIKMPGFSMEDALFLAGIVNNEPLPFILKLEE